MIPIRNFGWKIIIKTEFFFKEKNKSADDRENIYQSEKSFER